MRHKSYWLVGIVALAGLRAEAQTTGAWTGANNDGGGRLSVVTPGLASTAYKMAVVGNGVQGDSAYVEDPSPVNEARYRFRFYLDTNNWDTGITLGRFRTRLAVLADVDSGPGGGPRRLLMVALRHCPSGTPGCTFDGQPYGIVTRVFDSTLGAMTETVPPVSMAAGVHFIEGDWRRATAPGANDGSFQLWVDGVPSWTLSNLPNEALGVDVARIGAIETLLGNSGTLYFDEFESRRQTYIGPLP